MDKCIPQVTIDDKHLVIGEVRSKIQLEDLLYQIDQYVLCFGFSDNGTLSTNCRGFVVSDMPSKLKKIYINCIVERRKKQKLKAIKPIKKVQRLSKCLKTQHQQTKRLKTKVIIKTKMNILS